MLMEQLDYLANSGDHRDQRGAVLMILAFSPLARLNAGRWLETTYVE
jgi:hypothetical protein